MEVFLSVAAAEKTLELFHKRGTLTLTFASEEEKVEIFGTNVNLGPVVTIARDVTVRDEEVGKLQKEIEENDDVLKIQFVSTEESHAEKKYLRWMDKEEANRLEKNLGRKLR